MILQVINSNSAGNAYILEAENGEALLIECGVQWAKIKQALDFKISRVAGCLVTHSHGDHCKAVRDVLNAGIKVYATIKEHEVMRTDLHHNRRAFIVGVPFKVGSFDVIAFNVVHDTPAPVGYLIKHDECGAILFLTDTVYCPFTFRGLNNIIVEANYCETIIDARVKAGENPAFLRDRVIQSHMSIDHCIDLLRANDLTEVNNIVLIHFSDGNSHEANFKKRVEDATGKSVTVANPGTIVNFNLTPY